MKKYYFQSKKRSLVYIAIVLFLIGCIVLSCFDDEIHSGVIFVITFLSISVIIIIFWIGFTFSMRIQIDYINKELYIRYPYFIKKIKFEDIKSIEIIEYKETAFEFFIITNTFTKKIPYARYLKSRPNDKIKLILSE